uniref:DUF86 domain-containing protein n=1 Tax=Methylobacterium flocculans TaxID=2984843 RepID=UPI0021F36633|nr:DUF86 domain-containing protein [Methylobacterium sp. FF17]
MSGDRFRGEPPRRRRDPNSRNAHIPWRRIADSGNVYRHRYERVSARLLWGTVHEPLPGLLVVCQNELRVGE